MRTILVFVSVVVVLIVAPVASADRHEPSLSRVASNIAGKPVSVVCVQGLVDSPGLSGGADGSATVGGRLMYLSGPVCATLLRKAAKPEWARALMTIAHEAQHLKGVEDESEADCSALKIAASVGIRFYNLTRQQLHKIMAQAWADHRAAPSFYRTLC